MAQLAKFLPYVLPYATSCPVPLAEQVLRAVCFDFCSRTNIIQSIATQNVVAGVADYEVDVPSGMDLGTVISVFYGDTKIMAVPLEAVTSGSALAGATVGGDSPTTGSPTCYFLKMQGDPVISLFPVPDVGSVAGLTIRASFTPSITATSVDDRLFNEWADAIASGAIARLLAAPDQSFGNSAYAPFYDKRYLGAVSDALSLSRRGQITGSSRVQARSFGF